MLRSFVPQITEWPLLSRRYLSSSSPNAAKRFLQTAPRAINDVSYVPYKQSQKNPEPQAASEANGPSSAASWSRHGLPSRSFGDLLKKKEATPTEMANDTKEIAKEAAPVQEVASSTSTEAPKKKKRRALKPRKALITLSPSARAHLQSLLEQPTPQLIRVGVKNRGCSGLTYNLEYIEQPQKFDEVVEQDGIKVVIDSKALFSIVGSEMDWIDDKLSSRFVFRNPNSKGTCGCGESFMV